MKIRGNTVGTPLKPEKAVVKCQNLSEEEKAQARENIGAVSQQDFEQRNDDIYFDISYCVSAAESQTFTDAQKALVRENIGAAKAGKYELIETIKLTEDTASIERTQEPDGTPYAFHAVYIKAKLAVGSASGSLRADFNGDQIISGGTQFSTSSQMYTKISAEVKYGKFFGDIEAGTESEYHTAVHYSQRFANSMVSCSDIHSLKLLRIGNVIDIPAGSQFEIWAVRK